MTLQRALLVATLIALPPLVWFQTRPRPEPVGVEKSGDWVPVRVENFEVVVRALGKIEPGKQATLSVPISGIVSAVNVRPGDTVVRGQPVVSINAPFQISRVKSLRATLAKLTSAIASRTALLEESEDLFAKRDRLAKGGSATQLSLFQAGVALRVARESLSQARSEADSVASELAAEEELLEYQTLRSPLDGRVFSVEARVGQVLVSTDASPPLLTIGNMAGARALVEVAERDVSDLNEGMPCRVSFPSFPHLELDGVVARIIPAPQTINGITFYSVEVELKGIISSLLPGMSAQALFKIQSIPNAVTIPTSAVWQEGGVTKAAIRKQGGYEVHTLLVDRSSRGRVAVLKGLKAGDQVLVPFPLELRQQ